MSIEDLRKMGSHLQGKRFSEQPMTQPKKITFSRENFKTNITKVGGALRSFGEKHPNLKDPSWLTDNRFDSAMGFNPPRVQQQHKKKHKHRGGGQHIHIHVGRY